MGLLLLSLARGATWYADQDGDGFGDPSVHVEWVGQPPGYVHNADDCGPLQASVHPGAPERCDAADRDCDGDPFAGAVDIATWYVDGDHDGWGGLPVQRCRRLPGTVAREGDCDDTDAARSPGATEVCAGGDEDCDGLVGLDDPSVADAFLAWHDADGDGLGSPDEPGVEVCEIGRLRAANDDDCDDSDPTVGVGLRYADADGDGHGDPADVIADCGVVAGRVDIGDDCADGDPDTYPGAPETDCLDPVDHNCDGAVGTSDGDADGWVACEECDDGLAEVYPGAPELCNERDDDCDGDVDGESVAGSVYAYQDADGDGWGDPSTGGWVCDGSGITRTGDCDDGQAGAHPFAREACGTAYDDDCNGELDQEGAGGCTRWYVDLDGDAYGSTDLGCWCANPGGAVSWGNDCDDADTSVSPAATEVCGDGIDNDCTLGEECAITLASTELYGAGGGVSVGGGIDVVPDTDGDGVVELLLGGGLAGGMAGGEAGEAYLASGASRGALALPRDGTGRLLGSATGDHLGFAVAGLDADGDGVGDVAAGARDADLGARDGGAVYLVYGPVSGDVDVGVGAEWLAGTGAAQGFGWSVVGADLTADGQDDLVVGSQSWDHRSTDAGRIDVYDAPHTGDAAVATIRGESGMGVGAFVDAPGDLDGDGVDDLLVGRWDWGGAALFAGPLSGSYRMSDAVVEWDGWGGGYVGWGVGAAGDVDGDGTLDVWLGDPSFNIRVFRGPFPATVASDDAALVISWFGVLYPAVAGGIDVDGDGGLDLVLGDPWNGRVSVFDASATGTADASDARLTLTGSGYLGMWVAGVPDLDGDGRDEVVAQAPGGSGEAWLLLGADLP